MAKQARGGRKTTQIKTGSSVAGLGSKPSTKTGSSTRTRGNNRNEFNPTQRTGSDIHTTGNKESSH